MIESAAPLRTSTTLRIVCLTSVAGDPTAERLASWLTRGGNDVSVVVPSGGVDLDTDAADAYVAIGSEAIGMVAERPEIAPFLHWIIPHYDDPVEAALAERLEAESVRLPRRILFFLEADRARFEQRFPQCSRKTVVLPGAREAAVNGAGHAGTVLRGLLARERRLGHTFDPPTRVVAAGHDFKFFDELEQFFQRRRQVTLRFDRWEAAGRCGPHTDRLLDWADCIFCEWCIGNAAWYSRHKRDDQRLVIRFHAFEERTQYPTELDIDAVDAVFFVGDHKRRSVMARFGWPEEKLYVLPNFVDVPQYDRPKRPDAAFTLGVVGIVPMLKRFDRCLDLLEQLRARDLRYRLRVKSRMPWEFSWVWSRPAEQKHYQECIERINTSPLLRGAVRFDPHDERVGAWFRDVGYILSTSDTESFHLAAAEGMASGAVPIIFDWGGAASIFSSRWIVRSVGEAALRVDQLQQNMEREIEGRVAQDYVRAQFDTPEVLARLENTLFRPSATLQHA